MDKKPKIYPKKLCHINDIKEKNYPLEKPVEILMILLSPLTAVTVLNISREYTFIIYTKLQILSFKITKQMMLSMMNLNLIHILV